MFIKLTLRSNNTAILVNVQQVRYFESHNTVTAIVFGQIEQEDRPDDYIWVKESLDEIMRMMTGGAL